MQKQVLGRYAGVDAGRFVAIIGIILIHAANGDYFRATKHSDGLEFYIDTGRFLGQMSRFSVPFFFISSGFFLSKKLQYPFVNIVFDLLKRMIPIYFIWSLFYVLVVSGRSIWFTNPRYILDWAVNGGPGYHLWFLPALVLNIVLAAYLKPRFSWPILIFIAIILYSFGLVMGSYLPVFVSGPDIAWMAITRDTPCFGLIFILSGLYFAEYGTPTFKTSYKIFIYGGIFQITEAVMLNNTGSVPFNSTNYLIGTVPYALGAFGIALNLNSHSKIVELCAKIGRLGLGIYAAHVFFIWVIDRLHSPINLFERMIACLIVFILSVLTALIVSRIKQLKFLVA